MLYTVIQEVADLTAAVVLSLLLIPLLQLIFKVLSESEKEGKKELSFEISESGELKEMNIIQIKLYYYNNSLANRAESMQKMANAGTEVFSQEDSNFKEENENKIEENTVHFEDLKNWINGGFIVSNSLNGH